MTEALVHMHGWLGTGLQDVTSDLSALDGAGRWFVVAPFDGPVLALRFEHWSQQPPPSAEWAGRFGWVSDRDRAHHVAAVGSVRGEIAAGNVYQANLCRLLSAPAASDDSLLGLYNSILANHPAPHAAYVSVVDARVRRILGYDLEVASASPELALGRAGRRLHSSPIKGTRPTGGSFAEKDSAENVMIVDLVRNDLSRVCVPGTVAVSELLQTVHQPGLDHLQSTVNGELAEGSGWQSILDAVLPAGSISGAPKLAALELIRRLERPRGIYCGALGWVDADAQIASLNVAIRTFFNRDGRTWFGTGGGITWGSDPEVEWAETELKADRLIALAERQWRP